jgi:hypothetical protein
MSAGWPMIGNYTFVHLQFNCLYILTISSTTSHCLTLYVALLYQNSCFRIAGSIAAKVRRSAAGAYICLFNSTSEIAQWAWFPHMRRRVEDDTGTVEDVGFLIANAQDKDRADAAAAALRPLFTFIDSTVKSSLLTSCRDRSMKIFVYRLLV